MRFTFCNFFSDLSMSLFDFISKVIQRKNIKIVFELWKSLQNYAQVPSRSSYDF